VKLLLDTHVLLWWLDDHRTLPPSAFAVIKEGQNLIFVSSASAWEISIKRALGKLKAPTDLEKALEANRFLQLPISVQHAMVAGDLPRHHDDPFDRMLIAQASVEGLTLVSHDPQMDPYGVRILWK
jgi:PIN domain nuclease of toxin-antitoxin system